MAQFKINYNHIIVRSPIEMDKYNTI